MNTIKYTLAAVCLAALSPMLQAEELPELYGSVIYADGWTTQENEIGMYRIGTSAELPFARMGSCHVDASSGGVVVGKTYWATYSVDIQGTPFPSIIGYSTDTWEETSFDYAEVYHISTGVAFDRTSGIVYGCFRNKTNNGYEFGTIDYESAGMPRATICKLKRMWSAVAIDRTGILYAIDDLGDLYTVNKSTGEMTSIGSTGLRASHPSSACIDPKSGRCFYAITTDNKGMLYEINLADASATLVYNFPRNEEVVGMFIPAAEADDKAPGYPSEPALSFSRGALNGSVTFTAPATLFDGSAASGDLSYTITANGNNIADGITQYGKKTVVNISFPKADTYTVSVKCTNDAGTGPEKETKAFIGKDTPVMGEVRATRSGLDISLEWDAVTISANGGWIDADNMRYTVVRLPDNKVIASSTSLTSASDHISNDIPLTGYSYTVTASAAGMSSRPATTQKFWTGAVTPPYSAKFDEGDNAEPYIVCDANGDGETWRWYADDNAFKTWFNRASDNDDWLFTPSLRLKAGYSYKVTVTMRTYLGNPETMEIAWGSEASPKGMTAKLINPVVIKHREGRDYTVYLVPIADGDYHLGIHSISRAAESWYLYVDGITVETGVRAAIPAVVSDFTVTPDPKGAKEAKISFKAPTKALDGTTLNSIDRISLSRDGKIIKIFSAPAPGGVCEYTDPVGAMGYVTYQATAWNEHGEGLIAEKRVFIGVNCPAKPEWARVSETANTGEVLIEWSPVTRDTDGNPILPELVTYSIYTVDNSHNGEAYAVAEDLSGTTYKFTPMLPGEPQKFVYYAIRAYTESDYSLMTLTDFIPIGPAYTAPYVESFAGGKAKTLMRPEEASATWSIFTDNYGIPSQDNDGGLAAMFGDYAGNTASLYSGKISLAGMSHPALSLYTYNIKGTDDDLNHLEIAVSDGSGFKSCKTVTICQLGTEDGWYPVYVPLDEYAGKDIQFRISGTTHTRKYTCVDNIRVQSRSERDLSVASVNVEAPVSTGAEARATAVVENHGVTTATGHKVTLHINGRDMATISPGSLEPGEAQDVCFTFSVGADAPETSVCEVSVDFDGDNDIANNTLQRTFAVRHNAHPAPRNLQGNTDGSRITLSWEAPDMAEAVPAQVTEDFESWTPWATAGEAGWTFADIDKGGVGMIQNVELPGITYNSPMSWMVTDDSSLPNSFAAHSGNRYLGSLFNLPLGDFSYVPNDDWAISPRLYGGQQTIRLFARSLNDVEAEESFEVLYSTKDSTDPADFVSASKVESVPGAWTEFEFQIPDGAKRFAIRYDKTYGFMLHIDDVSYIPEGTAELELEGYNIYRDGICMNDAPISQTFWVDENPGSEIHTYGVSAHYGESGESRVGVTLRMSVTAVDDIDADAAEIVVSEGHVTAIGCMISIYDLQGVLAAQGHDSVNTATLPSGIYIAVAETSAGRHLARRLYLR